MIKVAGSEALTEAPALGGFPIYLSLYGISLYITTAGFAHSNRRICTYPPPLKGAENDGQNIDSHSGCPCPCKPTSANRSGG